MSVAKELIKALAAHLKAAMPELKQILEDFPSANDQLLYPSLTILQAGEARYEASPAWEVSRSEPDEAGKVLSRYVTGYYEHRLQLDFWCSTKEDRHRLYAKFYDAFNSQFPVQGLSLLLPGYFNTIGRFDISGYDYGDNEQASQRREWRVRVQVEVNVEAILEKEHFAIQGFEMGPPPPTVELPEDGQLDDLKEVFTV